MPHIAEDRTRQGREIDSVMLEETFVLRREHRVNEIRWYVRQLHPVRETLLRPRLPQRYAVPIRKLHALRRRPQQRRRQRHELEPHPAQRRQHDGAT
nr:hypothetical protein [Chthoniobacter flavus]